MRRSNTPADILKLRIAFSVRDKRTSAVSEDIRGIIAAECEAQSHCRNLTWAEKDQSLPLYRRDVAKRVEWITA